MQIATAFYADTFLKGMNPSSPSQLSVNKQTGLAWWWKPAKEKKNWIQTNCTLFKNWPCVTSCLWWRAFLFYLLSYIIIILPCHQHRCPWASLATSLYCSSLLAGQRGLVCRWVRTPPLLKEKKGVSGITLIFIWWWGSSSGALESMEYLFITITPRSTLTQIGSIC